MHTRPPDPYHAESLHRSLRAGLQGPCQHDYIQSGNCRKDGAQLTQRTVHQIEVARGLDLTASIFKGLAENPTNNNILDDILIFNIPVCDLDLLPNIYHREDCRSMTNMGPATASECVHYIIADNCKKLRLGDSQWPYGT